MVGDVTVEITVSVQSSPVQPRWPFRARLAGKIKRRSYPADALAEARSVMIGKPQRA